MDNDKLKALVIKCLDDFYQQRTQQLDSLKLIDFLGYENPYLLRAIGTYRASDIITNAMTAHLDSLDGGIFSDTFFEPVARILFGKVATPNDDIKPSYQLWDKFANVPNFHLLIIRLMETQLAYAKSYQAYQDAWSRAVNRCMREFIGGFCDKSGAIDWVKLVEFNSGNHDLDKFIT